VKAGGGAGGGSAAKAGGASMAAAASAPAQAKDDLGDMINLDLKERNAGKDRSKAAPGGCSTVRSGLAGHGAGQQQLRAAQAAQDAWAARRWRSGAGHRRAAPLPAAECPYPRARERNRGMGRRGNHYDCMAARCCHGGRWHWPHAAGRACCAWSHRSLVAQRPRLAQRGRERSNPVQRRTRMRAARATIIGRGRRGARASSARLA
jgi:hypothetical protein